ncbi:MAG: Hsp70 suppressor, GTPase facilitates ribosomal subunit dissociation [Lichina confinis]|nr:MAG: Hsp70 suppressor, GTPase facilitates ribosomal subunit dissociation [Lichina confinis]
MSRHKLVKRLDLDEELNDFDGGDDGYEEAAEQIEMTEDDKEHMRNCTATVRQELGDGFPQVSTKEIEDSLWYYYYDTEKTVHWLRKRHAEPKPKKAQTSSQGQPSAAKSAGGAGIRNVPPSSGNLQHHQFQAAHWISAASFFADTPWLKVPLWRQGAMHKVPCHARGGLLGGSSTSSSSKGKVSKLQALARQRRDNSRSSLSDETAEKTAEKTEPQQDGRMRMLQKISQRKRASQTSSEMEEPSNSGPRDSGSSSQPEPVAQTEVSELKKPSPDDVVTAAQSSKGKPAKKGAEAPTAPIENGVRAINIDPQPPPKRKKVDVVAEINKTKRKPSANFVVIGKSRDTLFGRLLLDLKVVESRTIDKYRREAEKVGKSSFALAWVLDQTAEERSRGITMDVATNRFETDQASFTILDAPGHRDFIPNMIAGASQADFAVLVIDASPNAFESGLKGQTREHALLVRSMGVQRIVVVANKMDMTGWEQERFDEIKQQVLVFLTTAGFQGKAISFVPCSGLSGDNVIRRTTDSRASWYSGPTLIETLEESSPTAQALNTPFRMTIGDIFRGAVVHPLSVSGRIEAGTVQLDEAVVATPSGEKATIKGIEIDQQPADWAIAGQIVTLHLTDIDAIHLKVGDVLCPSNDPIQTISGMTVKALVFDHLMPMAVDVHRGHLHAAGHISQLVGLLDKASGATTKKKPKIIKPGSVARIKIELDQPAPLEPPVRVILRSNGETVAAGIVESVVPKQMVSS